MFSDIFRTLEFVLFLRFLSGMLSCGVFCLVKLKREKKERLMREWLFIAAGMHNLFQCNAPLNGGGKTVDKLRSSDIEYMPFPHFLIIF